MDISIFMSNVNMIIVGICLCIGYIIKNIITTDKVNRFIPLILGTLGLIMSVYTADNITLEVILSGLFSGLLSTGLYEAFSNLIKNGNKPINYKK